MHVGIDLGTTNSVLATFDGTSVSVVPNAIGENLTPSVVRIDARGTETVGRRAFRALETDPGNTRGEFKRLMGTAERIAFDASGSSFLPEELSARVLGSLLDDAESALGFRPVRAVISTPALFELPQNHATMRAGKLAGLHEVALLQEPIASAIAAGWAADSQGLWLVFDLGGGTLDVSLLETRDGWLRVVDHGGDNFLGGKDFDNALTDWAAARLAAEHGLPPLSRADRGSRRALAKLKAAAEQAKIDLSRAERAMISCAEWTAGADGAPLDADLEVSRSELEALTAPLLERSLSVCLGVLEKNRLAPSAIERVVFVGGPTLMPAVRARIGGTFGGRVAEGVDPMTSVARGAALYAATAGLDARPAAAHGSAAARGLALRMEHPAVTADTAPFVVGRFLPRAGEALPAKVRLVRADGGFETPDVAVTGEGSFVAQLALLPQAQNRFRLTALDGDGDEVQLQVSELAIVHGLAVADPPLARAVGIARSNDTVHVYFEKGTPLPARRTVVHRTAWRVAPGSGDDLLAIPVVQGEFRTAHLNRLIGRLRIPGAGLARDLPAGARVEVTLEIDRSGQLQARALLPQIGQSFEEVVHVLVPSASPAVLERELAAAEGRVTDLRRRGFVANQPSLVRALAGASALLAEARAGLLAARGGDADAAARVHRLLLDLNGQLEDVEGDLVWPELAGRADRVVQLALGWIPELGTAAEQQLMERALAALGAARQKRDAAELERQVRMLDGLIRTAAWRDPATPDRVLSWFETHAAEANDPARAAVLLAEARQASATQDAAALRAVLRRLDDLFPGDATERHLSFGSGIW
ncbi:MAG TPA: Hsp70 family protein [Thermoanaerobaculia bacterium]|jgi:molecular chaperone DnaK